VATGRLRHSAWWRKAPNQASERVNGEATGWAVADSERADSLITGEGEGADKQGPPARERAVARERGRAWLTGGAGLTVGAARARAGGGPSWASGGGDERAGKRGGGEFGLDSAQPGKGFFFPFSFLFYLFINLFFL
jgi:hypothetical protein